MQYGQMDTAIGISILRYHPSEWMGFPPTNRQSVHKLQQWRAFRSIFA